MPVVQVLVDLDRQCTIDTLENPPQPPRIRWRVTGPKPQSSVFLINVDDSLLSATSLEWKKDLTWYFETFLIHDPFSTIRANGIAQRLRRPGEELIDYFSQHEALHFDNDREEIQFTIQTRPGIEEFTTIDSLPWELLEDVSLWKNKCLHPPRAVSVFRQFDTQASRTTKSSKARNQSRQRPQRILAISARPNFDRDVPHRLITRAIYRAVQRYDASCTDRQPILEIVRPGSLDALIRKLESNVDYDVIHLDVHGYTNEQGSFLEFTTFDGIRHIADPVSAHRLAEILAKYGVEHVVLNACRSAAQLVAHASIAQALVQRGMRSVLGMSYNVSTSAAEIFVESFYNQYFTHSNILQATTAARASLRSNKLRASKFEEFVDLEDHVIPILYHQYISDESRVTGENDSKPEGTEIENRFLPDSCIGREADILALESYLAHETPILLHGQAGIGKSILLQEASTWWHSTGFTKGTLLIHAPEAQSDLATSIRKHLSSVLGEPIQTFATQSLPQLATVIKEQRLLLVLDSMESLQPTDDQDTTQLMKDFKKFLRPLRKGLVIVASRDVESWLDTVIPYTHELGGLDEADALKLGLNLMAEGNKKYKKFDHEDLGFFALSLNLISGHPLAIQILVRMLRTYLTEEPHLSCRDFYLRLLGKDDLNFQRACLPWDETGVPAACISSFQRLIDKGVPAQAYGHQIKSQLSLSIIQDVLQLAPFWVYIPADIHNYWTFMGLSVQRVLESLGSPGTQSTRNDSAEEAIESSHAVAAKSLLWASTFHEGEWEFMMNKDDGQGEQLGLSSEIQASRIWFERIRQFENLYFIQDPIVQRFGDSTASETRKFYPINPVFTLMARSYHRPQTLPWSQILANSFRRFMFKQVSSVAATGSSKWTWLPENDIFREQVTFDFANFAASSRTVVNSPRVYDEWTFQQLCILDIASIDFEPFANSALAVYDEYLGEMSGFVREEKEKMNSLSAEGHRFSRAAAAVEKYCLTLLGSCNGLAQMLGKSSQRYLALESQLRHMSLSNHPGFCDCDERAMNQVSYELQNAKRAFLEKPTPKALDDQMNAMKRYRLEFSKRSGRSDAFVDPRLIGTPVGEAFGRISFGGPKSFAKRYDTLSAALSVDDETMSPEEKRREIEKLLEDEISTTNHPLNRWHLYRSLSEFCRLVGDYKVGKEHRDRYLALEPMIDPDLLARERRLSRFWMQYHRENQWRLHESTEEDNSQKLSAAIKRLHLETEAMREECSIGALELQDCVYVEAGALERAGRLTEAINLLEELPSDYDFTSRSETSILGPQHNIAMLLLKDRQYDAAESKFRNLFSDQADIQRRGLVSMGLAQCILLHEVDKSLEVKDSRRRRLEEAQTLAKFAVEQRTLTHPSWHWENLVPRRMLAQILSLLGGEEERKECAKIMSEIQGSIMRDAQEVGNAQRLANLNEFGSFLLRCGNGEEAEQLFELLYVSCRLQKGEDNSVTLNFERNLCAALRAQGLLCDDAFVRENQKLKIQYHTWRQTVAKYMNRGDVVENFRGAAEVYRRFLMGHAHHAKVQQIMNQFLEEYNSFRAGVLGEAE